MTSWSAWGACTEAPGQCKEYGEWGGKQTRSRHPIDPHSTVCKQKIQKRRSFPKYVSLP
jgi:hypothetical protein